MILEQNIIALKQQNPLDLAPRMQVFDNKSGHFSHFLGVCFPLIELSA